MNQFIELLAPAKNVECGTAAINYGADAVYIGAPKFGARANAGNTLRDIETLATHAHRYWAKVYVTLNTLLFENELEEALRLAHDVYNAGADALIIQDMALLEMDMPPLPLFASTQTHNVDVERIKFLEQVGIRRVILARELSLTQIRAIRAATTVELESFVHGALCVSFSGQCYFSQATQSRSANRGECAQSCRMKYSLEDAHGTVLARDKHLLSLKDLNLSDHLSNLLDAGVTSFKIEGRLKDIDYVKNIVAFYRLRLDELLEQDAAKKAASSGSTMITFAPDPERTFNRGTTQYFIRGRKKDIVSMRTPKSIGKTIGTVTRVGRNNFEIDTELPLANGDGICYFDENDDLQGVNVNRAEGAKIFPLTMGTIRVGTVIYRNFDKEFVQALERDKTARKISVRIAAEESDDGIALTAVDEDGVTRRLDVPCEKIPAQHPERAVETMVIQLKKSGGSIFSVTEVDVTLNAAYYFSSSTLNAMRRDLLALLEEVRTTERPLIRGLIEKNSVPYPVRTLDYTANVANPLAAAFYRRHGVTEIEPAFELRSDVRGSVIMTTKHCLKFQFGMCEGKKKDTCATDHEKQQLLFLRDSKRKYSLEFDCDACQMKIILTAPK
jgi:23S rRNA 5-hydroxycytidine C2501 synthase